MNGLPYVLLNVMLSTVFFFFSSRRRHTRFDCDWSSDVCSSDLGGTIGEPLRHMVEALEQLGLLAGGEHSNPAEGVDPGLARGDVLGPEPVVHRQAAIQRVERFTGEIGRASCRGRG